MSHPPPPDRSASRQPVLMLVLVTLLWAFSFPLIKTWQIAARACPDGEIAATFTILAMRMLLALVLLIIWRPRLLWKPTPRERRYGAFLGALMFVSLSLQFWGLVTASPALSAFITSLGSAWVPILAWIGFGILVPRLTLGGLLIGIVGVAVLTVQPDRSWSIGIGETLTLLATFPFALQVLVLNQVGRRVKSEHLTVGLFFTTGTLALVGVVIVTTTGSGIAVHLAWLAQMLAQARIVAVLAALVLLPTVLAFLWMNQFQPQVPPGQAALIYLLEPIFTTFISIPWGHDTLTLRLVVGGAFVILGNLLVEWRAVRARRNLPPIQ